MSVSKKAVVLGVLVSTAALAGPNPAGQSGSASQQQGNQQQSGSSADQGQQSGSNQQQTGKGGSGTAEANPPPVAGGAVLGVEVRELAVVATGYRVSKLLNQPVYNDKNEKLGKLEEFIVKPDGTITWAIINVGGFLGVGAHRVAIPINQFSQFKPKAIIKGATKDAVKAMPEFTYSREQS